MKEGIKLDMMARNCHGRGDKWDKMVRICHGRGDKMAKNCHGRGDKMGYDHNDGKNLPWKRR